ncbi:PAS domain-containing protein [Candidatus Parcubacteria bacterium]|nr:MAG: PAS domain-containing protein [Candidatus Parcubacteria bacterium]
MSRHTPLPPEQLKQLRSEISTLSEGFDLIGEHVVITDPEGSIVYANDAVEKHTGFPPAEILGKNPGDLWGGIMDKDFYERMWKTIKEEKRPFIGDVQNRNKDGELYWQELHIFPVLDDAGDVKFFIGIEPDATIRKAFAGQTKQYIEELERLNAYLKERARRVSELETEVGELKERLKAHAAQ